MLRHWRSHGEKPRLAKGHARPIDRVDELVTVQVHHGDLQLATDRARPKLRATGRAALRVGLAEGAADASPPDPFGSPAGPTLRPFLP
jgi:hypothetical protein